ncbi:Mrp/NBP35 family ATP-binding protein [Sulfurihydrogenibium azorense]|jgi:ATP-binding protein involved in chromosome partitioning|uniref:Mrp/NBP35 family ATP-binding protein n=1 Tax=Sulfurihydrogenibium azorense TaxID=309806 RepID=UPI00240A16B3|nr:Mrp/NBP35 family ATP-binding protein [Sulfurihydrogenibium azorense]MDM7273342.1 Mrp/NBP35 family ATP-binding protein [Sulfurihydrogenibium azorense]
MALQGVIDALKRTTLQEIGVSFSIADLMKDLKIDGNNVYIKVFSPSEKYHDFLKEKIEKTLKSIGAEKVEVEFSSEPPSQRQTQPPPPPPQANPFESRRRIPNVKKVIAVASGKGGVGKSTVAVNLASALKKLGYNVGYLDADMYGPSGPTMFGAKDKKVMARQTPEGDKIIAPEAHGVKVMSIGFLLPSEDTPVIWRGPVLFKALTQFLFDVDWGEEPLDFLVIDLPPGTGDVQITLGQTAEIDGAVIVTTPQDVALIDVKKGIQMFNEVQIPILGVVENMSYFVCPDSGKVYEIFGKSKTEEITKTYGVELLGKIPIEPKVAEFSDLGIPIVFAKEDSQSAKEFINIAEKIIRKLSLT